MQILILCLQLYILIGGLLAILVFLGFKKENEVETKQFQNLVTNLFKKASRFSQELPGNFEELPQNDKQKLANITFATLKTKIILKCIFLWPILSLKRDLIVQISLNPLHIEVSFKNF